MVRAESTSAKRSGVGVMIHGRWCHWKLIRANAGPKWNLLDKDKCLSMVGKHQSLTQEQRFLASGVWAAVAASSAAGMAVAVKPVDGYHRWRVLLLLILALSSPFSTFVWVACNSGARCMPMFDAEQRGEKSTGWFCWCRWRVYMVDGQSFLDL